MKLMVSLQEQMCIRDRCESGYENLSLKDVERICDRKADKKDFLRGLEMDEIAVKANKFGGGKMCIRDSCYSNLYGMLRESCWPA